MALITARLEGGPFDGDSGQITGFVEPPPTLWAYDCPRPLLCVIAVHWSASPSGAPPEAEMYDHDRVTPLGVHVYVWKDTAGDLDHALRTILREPVPA